MNEELNEDRKCEAMDYFPAIEELELFYELMRNGLLDQKNGGELRRKWVVDWVSRPVDESRLGTERAEHLRSLRRKVAQMTVDQVEGLVEIANARIKVEAFERMSHLIHGGIFCDDCRCGRDDEK